MESRRKERRTARLTPHLIHFFVTFDVGTHFFEEMGSNFLHYFRLRHVCETVTDYVYNKEGEVKGGTRCFFSYGWLFDSS